MSRRRSLISALLTTLLAGMATVTWARDFCISLAELPTLAKADGTGPLVDLVQAFRSHYREGKIELLISPFTRSLAYVKQGRCDLHLPLIANPEVPFRMPGLRLTQESFGSVPFVLYYRRGLPEPDLNRPTTLRIETDQAHIDLFPFPTLPSSCVVCSLRKVAAGRVDGFLFEARVVNTLLATEKLDLAQLFYRRFSGKGVVQQSARGDNADATFTRLLNATRDSGEFDRIMGSFHGYDWRLPPP